MYKGAVFFDFDGTLTDETVGINTPTPKTILALERLRANGYATFLTTGRMKALTTLVSGKFTGLVTSNGAYSEVDGKTISNLYIDKEILSKAVAYMEKENICYALQRQTVAYTNGLKTEHFLHMLDNFNLARTLFRPIEADTELIANQLIISYESDEAHEKMCEAFKNQLSIKRHRFCLSSDINDVNVSKANGVKAVLEYLNIPPENAYAFGDGENDYTMLESVCHGVAMGVHTPVLKNVAEFVTKSVKEDGIYYALSEHYKLI